MISRIKEFLSISTTTPRAVILEMILCCFMTENLVCEINSWDNRFKCIFTPIHDQPGTDDNGHVIIRMHHHRMEKILIAKEIISQVSGINRLPNGHSLIVMQGVIV